MSKWIEIDAIGGYPSLELGSGRHTLHGDAINLNSARNGFEYILTAKRYRRVYLPLYTCDAMFESPLKLGIEIIFYHIGLNMEPAEFPVLNFDEAFVYTNYFGLKQDCVERLHLRYGNHLIVDNSQAFFSPAIPGVDTFYSPRKFFGVPDGGYLYTDKKLPDTLPRAESFGRFVHLIRRIESGAESGYADFRDAEESLCHASLQAMSRLTESLLESIDYGRVAQIRRENYSILHEVLGESNRVHLQMDRDDVPMVYPFLSDDSSLRQKLIDNRVFVATYWPNVKQSAALESVEYEFASKLVPLPIDQRYGAVEMKRIINSIFK